MKSEYRGVSFDKTRMKWRARFCRDNKKIHLGYFDTEISAAIAYDDFVFKLGEKHKMNFKIPDRVRDYVT